MIKIDNDPITIKTSNIIRYYLVLYNNRFYHIPNYKNKITYKYKITHNSMKSYTNTRLNRKNSLQIMIKMFHGTYDEPPDHQSGVRGVPVS